MKRELERPHTIILAQAMDAAKRALGHAYGLTTLGAICNWIEKMWDDGLVRQLETPPLTVESETWDDPGDYPSGAGGGPLASRRYIIDIHGCHKYAICLPSEWVQAESGIVVSTDNAPELLALLLADCPKLAASAKKELLDCIPADVWEYENEADVAGRYSLAFDSVGWTGHPSGGLVCMIVEAKLMER